MRFGHQRAHLGVLRPRVAHHDALDGRFEQLHEPVIDVALHQDSAARTAVLTSVVEHAVWRGRRRLLQVAVIEHDVGALAAQFQSDPLDLCGRACHHPRADFGGSREHDLADVGVGDEALPHYRALAGQHLKQVGRQPGVNGELAEPDRGQRRPLRRFDQHRVARCQRGRETPRRDRHREVPRRDDADHAERFVERDVQSACHRNLLAGQPFRGGGVELQHIADVAGLPLRVADRMPGVGDLERASSSTCASTAAAKARNAAARSAGASRAQSRCAALGAGHRVVDAGLVGLLDGAQHLSRWRG